MKVKTLGFKWKKPIPGALPIQQFFDHISQAMQPLGASYEIYVSRELVGNVPWWVGVVLRIRDSNNYTALKTGPQGKRILTAESLRDGKLVEPSFFIAHETTGNGLFTSHYLSTSLASFSFLAESLFRKFKESRLQAEIANAKTKIEEKRLRSEFKGNLEMEQFCHPKDFPTLVKQFEKISRAEWTVSQLGTSTKPFLALSKSAKNRKFILTFDEDLAALSTLSEGILKTAGEHEVTEIKVSGKVKGDDRDVFLHKDTKMILEEKDYDSIVGAMSLDLDNWRSALAGSKIISWLISVANEPSVKFEIEN